MNEIGESNVSKICEAIECIRKTLQCTMCHKLPDDPVAAKCGHPFCQGCVNKIVNTKRGVCAICKVVIIRSGLQKLDSLGKVIADFEALSEAMETDLGSSKRTLRQYQGKRKRISPRDKLSSRTSTTNTEVWPINKSGSVKRGKPKTVGKRTSLASDETIKIKADNTTKRINTPSRVEPLSRRTDNMSPVFTTDKLSDEIGSIGSTEKVKDWLQSEAFEEETSDLADFPESPAPRKSPPLSPTWTDSSDLESFPQVVSKDQGKSKEGSQKEKKVLKPPFLTTGEEIFDELQRERKEKSQLDDKKKSKTSSAFAESSWSELKQFKREARPNIRKRKRLDVSIGRPSSSKPVAEPSDKDDSGEKDAADINETIEDGKNRRCEKTEDVKDTGKKKMKPNIVGYETLKKNERFDINIEKLNKRQVKKIIGVVDSDGTLDASKETNSSLEKSLNKSNKLSLITSANNSRDRSNEEENSRPQSRQNESRPESRLSNNSQGNRGSDKFRLSTKIKSPTLKVSPAKECSDQNAAVPPREEKIQLASNSPVRTSNDFIRNKLSLRRPSSGSSRTTDRENKGIVITKLGKLCKHKNRTKFFYRGSTRQELVRNGLKLELIKTRDAQTQTNPEKLDDLNKKPDAYVEIEDRGLKALKIPQTSTASAVSTGLRRIEEVGVAGPSSKTTTSYKSPLEELDTENRVNMLSPKDDSQLKYLATESPSVPRNSFILKSDHLVPRIGKTHRSMGESSLFSSGSIEYSKKVKKYAENLIVTDSEDQETPIENFKEVEKNQSEQKSPRKSNRENEDVNTASERGLIIVQESSSVRSGENLSPTASPKSKKRSRKSSGSRTKRHSAEKPKSQAKIVGNYKEDQSKSDTKTVKVSMTKSIDNSHHLDDSEPMSSILRHKVVRKLDYSQESGSNCNTEPKMSRSNDKEKKKTFQKAPIISSSDSEDELLEISMTTKESSSNSQTIIRPRPSQVCGSPILSEDMSVVFSSNKETVEPKRKRSHSSNSLDNNDLVAISTDWRDTPNRSPKEVAADNDTIFKCGKDASANLSVPLKKPKIDTHGSPMSVGSDLFPALSPTATYGSRKGGRKAADNAGKSPLSFAGRITPAKNGESLSIDDLIRPDRSRPESTPKNNSSRISPAGNIEQSMKRGNTFSGKVTTSKSATPIKARSLEDRGMSSLSHNSNKKNELQGETNAEASTNLAQKVTTRGDSNKAKESATVPSKPGTASNTELFESFDGDYLNITQEQLLMQEVEDNLLGRKSKSAMQKKSQDKVVPNNKERTPSKRETLTKLKPKGYQIAQMDSDKSMNDSDEDIIESTPEKNSISKKDLSTLVENSQRSNASLKSFMSEDMTPIPNRIPKLASLGSDVSPLVQRNSRLSSDQKNLSTHISSHSTPKTTTSLAKKSSPSSVQNRRKLCFVCSCLTLPQVEKVKAFAEMHNIEFTNSYKPEVTHVIVEMKESDTASRTLKYLLGVAHKKWIVSYRWVLHCMSAGRLLPEERYEAVDDTEEPGPQRSRLSTKGLFDKFAFVCMKPFTDITVLQLQDLLTSTGGIVKETLEELASVNDRYKVILYNGDAYQQEVLAQWRVKGRALPVQVEWALSCISQYYLMTFRAYLDSSNSELVLDMGFPSEFIVDEDDSDNDTTLQSN